MQDSHDGQRISIHRPAKRPRTKEVRVSGDTPNRKSPRMKEHTEASTQEQGLEDEEYNMNHPRRGYALIFNHNKFKNKCMKPRYGSENDVAALKGTFTKLGFKVKDHIDVTYEQLLRALKSIAKQNHEDCDCLVVVVMTHGDSDMLRCYDSLYSQELLWNAFTEDKCPSLAGKPKLFFIQACRGKKTDVGVKVMQKMDMDTWTEVDGALPLSTGSTCRDTLVAHATVYGYVAWRSGGAWFIRMLCEELDKYGRERHMLDILTLVCRRVATEYISCHTKEEYHLKKQVPVTTSTLSRQVFFR